MNADMTEVARIVVLARVAALAVPVRDELAGRDDLDVRVAASVDEAALAGSPHVAIVAGGDDGPWSVDTCRRLVADPRWASTIVTAVAAVDPAAAHAAGAMHVARPDDATGAAAWAAALALAAARAQPLLARAFGSCPVGLALLDAGLRCVRVNAAFAQLAPAGPVGHTGRLLGEVLPLADLDAVQAAARDVLATGAPRLDVPVSGWSPRTKGAVWHGSADVYAVDHGGVALGLLLRDVTAERVARAELEQALERERATRVEVETYQKRLEFVHTTTGALYSTAFDAPLRARTLAGLVVPSLADWCLVFGRPRAGGPGWRAAAHWDPDRMAQAEDLIAGDAVPAWAVRPLNLGEPELVAEVAAGAPSVPEVVQTLGLRSYAVVPLRAARGPCGAALFGFAESNRRYTPRDLELLLDLAQRAAIALENAELYRETGLALRGRDQLISIASHDVRNPISAALLRVSVMRVALDRGELPTDKLAEGLRRVEGNMQQAVALLNDLLNVTRIAAGRIELKQEHVDLRALTREVIERSRELLQAADCPITPPPPGPPVVGSWDRMRLEQVLANLLSNASKYGRGRPIEVRLEVRGGTASLAVQDRGVGIAAAEHERIFERFGRTADNERDDSHGLGLWIVKQVVTAMGGRVRVESEPGAGATFHVDLPLGPQRADQVVEP
ncbi:MAG: GAF domain-containing protein [Planctomycetes bacterium]|nr:GAF domain-containing protein [Planctomycetota bacterium]